MVCEARKHRIFGFPFFVILKLFRNCTPTSSISLFAMTIAANQDWLAGAQGCSREAIKSMPQRSSPCSAINNANCIPVSSNLIGIIGRVDPADEDAMTCRRFYLIYENITSLKNRQPTSNLNLNLKL